MSTRAAAAVIAALVVLVGILLGFGYHATVPGPSYEHGKPTQCGAAFAPDSDAKTSDMAGQMTGTEADFEAQCSDALGGPRTIAWMLTGVGALGLLFCALTASRSVPARPSADLAPGAAEDE